ncbi:MAG: hypothetical protein KDA90_05760 [Planctomycetaceae bacterium]|nr:hypothetical protein [Planctomycetaceae bacterium]
MLPSPLSRWFVLSICCLLSGCGSAEYEARLQRTKELYGYLNRLDSSLSKSVWNRPDVGMAMRLPIPFKQVLPAPVPEKDEQGNPLPVLEDPRQPHILGVDLPGLVEAWQTELPIGGGEVGEARLFVCSNHQRFLDLGPNTPKPEDLLTDLEIALQTGFGVTLAVGESSTLTDNVRTRLIAPPRSSQDAQYTTPKDFTAIRFVPREPLAGQDIEGIVYAYKAGKIQMAVVCLLPRNTGAQFRERLTTALQTLVVSPDAPKPRKGTAGAPAGGANPGF